MSGAAVQAPLSWRRLKALVTKETRQLVRDKSNLMVGLFLPVVLILIFGYGLSFDVKNAPVAIVTEDTSPAAQDVVAGFYLSPYFSAIPLTSMQTARELMLKREVDAIVYLQSDFSRQLAAGHATVQVLVHGVDANRARVLQAFAQGAIGQWAVKRAAAGQSGSAPPITLQTRLWFNEANNSTHFLVPGLIVLIMTLNGALLTSLVMAREWERGTLESLFVTPVNTNEIIIAKLVPYFVVGLAGLTMCLLAGKFLFHVPIRGSLLLIIFISMVYLLVSLSLGLLISAATKNQFLASQIALVVSFLPALMLSGFIFDLNSVPAVVRGISRVLPPTYYVEALQTLFLAGDVSGLLIKDCAVLVTAAVVLIALTRRNTRKVLG
ncbi:ABC-2 type transport system permease protein [Povalibacter uvarum]|uniref:ABC-2 type transport system permease protein n=1 Tax=Povalibacter uvarum TaxID=732238 RepID=A0A841HNN1_9GAMM|nr:ABC transporter permease [Povalibacter uvarum]MBB6094737.1 ABC-2 type transport system permease protein [Povalibacter uvarum]